MTAAQTALIIAAIYLIVFIAVAVWLCIKAEDER